jgi:hypothetical protein
MGIGSIFRKLVGAGDEEQVLGEVVEYQGFQIRPAPKKQGGQFYTAGVISKSFPEGVKEHHFIRADTHQSRDNASQHALVKGRQIIDEQGDGLFKDN